MLISLNKKILFETLGAIILIICGTLLRDGNGKKDSKNIKKNKKLIQIIGIVIFFIGWIITVYLLGYRNGIFYFFPVTGCALIIVSSMLIWWYRNKCGYNPYSKWDIFFVALYAKAWLVLCYSLFARNKSILTFLIAFFSAGLVISAVVFIIPLERLKILGVSMYAIGMILLAFLNAM